MRLGAATIQQVVAGYEDLSMSLEDIGSQLDLSKDVVEYCLLQHSTVYKETKKTLARPDEPLSLDDCIREYALLAKMTENEVVKEKALRNLIDELKGRNDVNIRLMELKEKESRKGGSQDERIKKFNVLVLQMNGTSAPSGKCLSNSAHDNGNATTLDVTLDVPNLLAAAEEVVNG